MRPKPLRLTTDEREKIRAKSERFRCLPRRLASSRAGEAPNTTTTYPEQRPRTAEEFLRENPFASVLGALALGILIGFLAAHRREPTLQERYLDGPLEDLGKTLRFLGEKTARQKD